MQLLRRAHEFEYRTVQGADQFGTLDVWTNDGGARIVLVVRGVAVPDAPRALRSLNEAHLPYLLPARMWAEGTDVVVLVIHPDTGGEKARARVLPLSA